MWVHKWGKGDAPLLLSGADPSKDQSYFLCGVNGTSLKNVYFPLGNLKKSGSSSSVRELALSLGLPTARKRESMGICFIGKRRFPDFISEYLDKPPREGNFVCVDTGKVRAMSVNHLALNSRGLLFAPHFRLLAGTTVANCLPWAKVLK